MALTKRIIATLGQAKTFHTKAFGMDHDEA